MSGNDDKIEVIPASYEGINICVDDYVNRKKKPSCRTYAWINS